MLYHHVNFLMFSDPTPDITILLYEPTHDKTNKMHVRPAKSQISLGIRSVWSRVFVVRMMKDWVLSYSLRAKQRLWSDWADAQADLSLRWAHIYFVGFVMRWRIYLCILNVSTVANRDGSQNLKHRMVNSWDEAGSVLFAKVSASSVLFICFSLQWSAG